MPSNSISRAQFKLKYPDFQDIVALGAVLVIMILSWFLVHGVATTVYNQYSHLPDPALSMGPMGETSRSQLGHSTFFWSERAFHYRTTLMFAVDDYDSVDSLKNDTRQQYPDGINAWQNYTLLMEPVYGQLYRWFGQKGETLDEFLLRLIPLVHVLLFLPLFLLARVLGVRPWLAAVAVLIYATCTMGFARLTGSLLLKENFALLWLMIFLAAHHRALIRKDLPSMIIAGLALILTLASWHLSQFLILIVLLATGFGQVLYSEQGQTKNKPWLYALVIFGACLVAGFTPSLLHRGFFLSLLMAAAASWLISGWLTSRTTTQGAMLRRFAPWAGSLFVLCLLVVFNPWTGQDYSHVSGLFFQKIRHGFVRPTDPGSLPFDVRIFWAPPFTSPTGSEVSAKLGFHFYLLLAAVGWFGVSAARRRIPATHMGFVFTALAYGLAWLMIERMGVVFWPLAAVMIVLAAEQIIKNGAWPGRGNPILVLGLLLLLAPALNLAESMKPQVTMAQAAYAKKSVRLGIADLETAIFKVELFDWLRRETSGPGSAFANKTDGGVLGEIGVSPQVLLYARRPIVLNSQFENAFIRNRYQQYLKLLFGSDEAAFENFLIETDTRYLFINRDWATGSGAGSVAWQAGLQGDLNLQMLISRLHFKPNSFTFLKPVFDNEYYRVFRIGTTCNDAPSDLAWESNQGVWWDEKNYSFNGGQLVDPLQDRKNILKSEKAWEKIQEEYQNIMSSLGRSASASNPVLALLHQKKIKMQYDNFTGAKPADARELAQLDQQIMAVLKSRHAKHPATVSQLLIPIWRGTQSRPGMEQLLKSSPSGPVHHASAGQLLSLLNQYEMAAEQFEKAAAFFPLQPLRRGRDGCPVQWASPMASQIRQQCVWWNVAAKRYGHAVELAGKFRPFEKPGSPQKSFYGDLINRKGDLK
ncbi:MAG: hypothetical protein GY780_11075 [bacterium]|nr:hypothetical protein [bacterium]